MRRLAILVMTLAACGNVTDEATPIGPCAESTRELWPVKADARWVYRVTDRMSIVTDPIGGLPPDIGWKEQVITENVPIGGLAGDERAIQMRSIDSTDAYWDYAYFVERDRSYRWVSKVLYRSLVFPPAFPLDEDWPNQERFYSPPRTGLDYSGEHLCVNQEWTEQWEAFKYELYNPPLPEQTSPDVRPCLYSTWRDQGAWACDPAVVREGSTWRVVAADATVALFNDRVFYEGALCLKRLDDNFLNDSLHCWVQGVGKVLECEVDHFSGDVTKVEELCLFCPPGDDCEWTAEEAYNDGVPPPPLCNELCLSCPEGEVCEWSEDDRTPPPDCALTDNWDAKRCEDALIY